MGYIICEAEVVFALFEKAKARYIGVNAVVLNIYETLLTLPAIYQASYSYWLASVLQSKGNL